MKRNRSFIERGLTAATTVAALMAGEGCHPGHVAHPQPAELQEDGDSEKTLRMGNGETPEHFGSRICDSQGEGIYHTPGAQLTCRYDGSYSIINFDKRGDPVDLVNYRQPEKKLSFEQLTKYVQDKQVTVFGEVHDPNSRRDSDTFIKLLPHLKKMGFNNLALEIDRSFQPSIDQYMSDPTFSLSKDNITLPYPTFMLEMWEKILEVARENGFKVLCVDDTQNFPHVQDSFSTRDQSMMKELKKVVEAGERILWFGGKVHASGAKEDWFAYQGDPREGGRSQILHTITPMLRQLKDAGTTVGGIDLSGCSRNVPKCYSNNPNDSQTK